MYNERIQQYKRLAEKLRKRFFFSLSRSLPLLFDYIERMYVCGFGFRHVCQLALQSLISLSKD